MSLMHDPEFEERGEKDSCRTCPFNGVHPDRREPSSQKIEGFFCGIRIFPIEDPDRTFCSNHPARNPLRSTRVRGPIWAAVHISLDSKPLSREVRIPPEFVPPQGVGLYFRIPFFGVTRPLAGGAGPCHSCGNISGETIRLAFEDHEKCFCSAAHYFEWWLRHDPEALERYRRLPLEQETIHRRLARIPEALFNGMEGIETEGTEWLVSTLEELESLIQEIRYRRISALHENLGRDDVDRALSRLRIEFSPQLQILQKQLTRVGEKIHSPSVGYASLYPWIEKIVRSVGVLLKQSRRD